MGDNDAKAARKAVFSQQHKKNSINKRGRAPDKVKKMSSDKKQTKSDKAYQQKNRTSKYLTKHS